MIALKFSQFLQFFIALLLIGTQASRASQDDYGIEVAWAPNVHELMIDIAFSKESQMCRIKMKAGSADADRDEFQNPEYSYMHAMRGPKDRSAEDASYKMWQYIQQRYTKAKSAKNISEGQYCYERGMALHPIMDSTSPAHEGFKQWNGYLHPSVFMHGDVITRVKKYFPKLPIFGIWESSTEMIPSSQEDMNYLDDHANLLSATVELMRSVDYILLRD